MPVSTQGHWRVLIYIWAGVTGPALNMGKPKSGRFPLLPTIWGCLLSVYRLVTDRAHEICPGNDGYFWAVEQVLPTLDKRSRKLYEAEADVAANLLLRSGFTATADEIEAAIALSGLEVNE